MPEDLHIPYEHDHITATMKAGSPMVVFSHGFGVKRDSRGMFTDIADSLPPTFGYVMFDFNDINGHNVTLEPYSGQAKKLNAVLQFAQNNSDTVYLVGHSMGCITASLLLSTIPKKVILLAPPVHGPRKKSNNTWAERPGAYYDGDTLIVPRKDGTTSIIPQSFFDESIKVDCLQAMQAYSEVVPLKVVQALDEEIIKPTDSYDLLPGNAITLIKTPGNHNFDPPHRQAVIRQILAILGA
jgi:pimeloyl-ACP methyl ester carboxylesterase